MKTILTAAVAACLILGAPTTVSAQAKPNKSSSATVDLKVCNESGRNATVAVSYVEVGTSRFINRGWFDVYNGSCIDLVSTDNANFYMYGDATDGSGRSWSGNHSASSILVPTPSGPTAATPARAATRPAISW